MSFLVKNVHDSHGIWIVSELCCVRQWKSRQWKNDPILIAIRMISNVLF